VTAADDFSLLITCAHFNMPPLAQRLAVTLPPTQVTEAGLAKARDAWPKLMADRKTPRIVFLVGGDSALHDCPADHAADLLRSAEAATDALGGSLTVVTSRRTPADAILAMQAVAGHTAFHLWSRHETDNPYLGYLAWADALIVTGESESMLAEAAAARKPLHIAPMPGKTPGFQRRLRRRMTDSACRPAGGGAMTTLCRALFNGGWMTPSRDLEKMHALMYEAGLARPFGPEFSLEPPAENRTAEPFISRMADILAPVAPPSLQA
jgi:mitochondrial fission protein ELM1